MTAAFNARAASFKPDAVMLFQARAARIEERRVNGIPSGRRVAGMDYSLDLLAAASKRTVYRAAASFAIPPPTAVPVSGPGSGR